MRLIDADVLLDKTVKRNSAWNSITNSEGKNLEEIVSELPSVNPQIPDQWQELKETIIELRDNDGIGTQQEVCKFLANYMDVLEKQMSITPQEPKAGHWKRISIDKYSEHAKYWYRCDRCGKDNLGNTDWCPNCGCRMVEPQESEDKNE